MKKFLLVCFSFVFALSTAWAQDRVVSGRVTSAEDGSSLPGVNVVLKGTTNGTVTDADGNYKLNVPASGGSLVYSFIGLTTQEVVVGERSVIDIQLALDVKQLSEVVVTGTGVATEKKKLAISVESVNADKLPAAPTASIDQALIGKIPGAQIQAINGTPGSQINIQFRGVNTINNSNGTRPMILVDGVQMFATDLNSLDLSSVERVETIAGAAAATIYGAQGANGVIQIFTKKGKDGTLDVNFSTSIATNEYLNIGGLAKANLHGFNTNASNEVIGGSGNPLVFDPSVMAYDQNLIWNSTDPTVKINKAYDKNLLFHDHIKEFFQAAPTYNNSISVSGGKDGVDYSVSASRNFQRSNFKGDGYNDRSNLVSNLGIRLAKGLKLRNTTQLVYTHNTIEIYNKQDFALNSLVYGIFNARPFVDYFKKDADGNYAYYYGDAAGVNQTNPNYTLQYNDTNDDKVDIVESLNLNYQAPKFFEFDARYGLNRSDRAVNYITYNQTTNANSNYEGAWVGWYNGSANDGEMAHWRWNNVFQNFLAKATATFDFAKDFGMSIPLKTTTLAAFDWRSQNDRYYADYGLGVPLDAPFTATQISSWRAASDYKTKFVTYGYLVTQRVDYGDIGGFTVGVRSDYSSAFGAGSKPFTFPRGDAYLRMSSFGFWQNSGLSDLIIEWKLRGAWGKAGVQPNPYDRYPALGTRIFGGTPGYTVLTSQPNPLLNVEVSQETEVGTDLVLDAFKGDWLSNIGLSFTYWKRSTDNAIMDVEAAPSTGIGYVRDNVAVLSSKGIQASLNAAVYKGANFNWNLTVNFGRQASYIDAIKGNTEVVRLSNAGSTNYVLRGGEKIGQLYGNHLLKSLDEKDPVTGNPIIDPANIANYEVASNGYVVTKAGKSPVFNPRLTSFGDPFPKFTSSFINDITYKNFLSLNVQIDWVQGNHLYNQTKEWMYRDGIHHDYTKDITINGETGAWSAFYRGIYANITRNGTKDYFYEDASFVRLRNVSVAVDFAKLLSIPKMKKLQIVLSGRNLWTKTKYTGMDPEISSGTVNSPWDRGTDHNTLPNFRTYQATLNVGF